MNLRSPWIIVGLAVLMGIITDKLFYGFNVLGINVLLFQLAFVGGCALLAHLSGRHISSRGWAAGAMACAFAATFALWAGNIGMALAGLGWFCANALFFIALIRPFEGARHPFHYVAAGIETLLYWILGLAGLRSLRLKALRLPSGVGRGILIAIPILIVFIALFSSADPAFARLWREIFDWIKQVLSLGHAFVVLFVAFASFAVWSAAFGEEAPPTRHVPARAASHLMECQVVLWTVNALFLVFVLMQSVYLFGGEVSLRDLGLTYAEYARRGFGELTVAAFLVLFLSLSLRYFHNDHATLRVRILHVALYVQTLILGISAALRLGLYVQAYGWTAARLLGFWALIIVAALLGVYAFYVWTNRAQASLMTRSLVMVGLATLFFASVSSEGMAVQFNMQAGRNIDVNSISSLSSDAAPVVIDALFNKRVVKPDGGFVTLQRENVCIFNLNWGKGRSQTDHSIPSLGWSTDTWLDEHAMVHAGDDHWQTWSLTRHGLTRCP